jgi:esterase/lipase superfamily enzyme
MSLRKILWLIIAVLVLVIIGIAGRFAAKQFTGLGPIPERSAFAGRLPGVWDGDRRRYQFFYATNRENSTESFDKRGNILGNKILTGTYQVLITPGMLIKPFIWFEEESMQWAGRSELSQDDFYSQLHAAVQSSPQKSLLFIVWGFRDWFRSAALKTAYTAYTLDINTPTMLFDWPGNQGDGSRGYSAAQIVSDKSAPDLARTLAVVIEKTGAEDIWIMGSSLGCQTICDAFVLLGKKPELAEGKQKISHVVLSAPDVAADAFNEQFAEGIKTFSKHLTAYVSSNDRALLMSNWLNRGRRLGRKAQAMLPPEERSETYEFEEALELMDLEEKGLRNVAIVDATPINFTRNLHHFFTDSPPFFDDLYQRLLRPDDIVSRRLHSVRTNEGRHYRILWND